MNDRLDSSLAALLQMERGRPDPSDAVRDRVLVRVNATVAIPPSPPSSSAPRPLLRLAPIIGLSTVSLMLIGGASGLLYGLHARHAQKAAVPAASSTDGTALLGANVAPANAASLAQGEPLRAPARAVASAARSVVRPSEATDLAAERALLDEARRELLQNEPGAALTPIGLHALRFPHGILSEERDALRVEALVAAARYDEARKYAQRFHASHPGSLLTPAVDDALGSIP